MKDEYGRINTKLQVIRSLANVRMAWLLNDIKENPDKYPNTRAEWFEWLNQDSGDSLDNL